MYTIWWISQGKFVEPAVRNNLIIVTEKRRSCFENLQPPEFV